MMKLTMKEMPFDHEEDALSNASPGELINPSAHCVATPESASSEAEEARELLLLESAKHI